MNKVKQVSCIDSNGYFIGLDKAFLDARTGKYLLSCNAYDITAPAIPAGMRAKLNESKDGWDFEPLPPEPPQKPDPEPDPKDIILGQLNDLDFKTVRPLRAILAQSASEEDREYLQSLEEQAQALRAQLSKLSVVATEIKEKQ